MLVFRIVLVLVCVAVSSVTRAQNVFLVDRTLATNNAAEGTYWECKSDHPIGPFLLQPNNQAFCFREITRNFASDAAATALQGTTASLVSRTTVLEATAVSSADLISALTNRVNKLEQALAETKAQLDELKAKK